MSLSDIYFSLVIHIMIFHQLSVIFFIGKHGLKHIHVLIKLSALIVTKTLNTIYNVYYLGYMYILITCLYGDK